MIKTCHVGVKGVVRVGNKCLVLKHGSGPDAYWDVPGGRIDDDETLEETLKRELSEELPTMEEYTIDKLIGAYRLGKNIQDDMALVLLFYKITAEEFDVELSDEHTSFKWVTKENVHALLESNNQIDKGYYNVICSSLND